MAKLVDSLLERHGIYGGVEKDTPVLMLFDKRNNRYQCWKLKPYVERITLKTEKAESVQLNVINQNPLQVELWVDTDEPIDITGKSQRAAKNLIERRDELDAGARLADELGGPLRLFADPPVK